MQQWFYFNFTVLHLCLRLFSYLEPKLNAGLVFKYGLIYYYMFFGYDNFCKNCTALRRPLKRLVSLILLILMLQHAVRCLLAGSLTRSFSPTNTPQLPPETRENLMGYFSIVIIGTHNSYCRYILCFHASNPLCPPGTCLGGRISLPPKL